MNIPTPEELRARRETLGMRQTEIAKRAGISQSMVARIEAGSVDPRVSTLNKIISVFNRTEPKKITAAQIMHAPVLSVQPQESISLAVEIFEKNNISQLPVIEREVYRLAAFPSQLLSRQSNSSASIKPSYLWSGISWNRISNGSSGYGR